MADRLRQHQAVESNCRKGNFWDNAPMESFFSSREIELLRQKQFRTRVQATEEMFTSIETLYNRQRIHSALGGLNPADFEAAN